jgi:putative nucleotidyltransferase with HDIG domain
MKLGNSGKTGLVDVDVLIRDATELEPLPASAIRLAALVCDDDPDLEEMVETIRLDEALTGRLLGAANSAASGARSEITTVRDAVIRLGPGTVLSLSIGASVGPVMRSELPAYGLSEGALWKHSVTTALAAERAGRHCRAIVTPEAFSAALLHDLGKLVMERHLSAEAVRSVQAAREQLGIDMDEAEREVLSIGHAQVGAHVARNWGLPESIALGIEHHHVPLSAPDQNSRRLCSVILLADAVASQIGAPCTSREVGFSPVLAGSLGITSAGFEGLCADVEARLEDVLAAYGSCAA